MEALLKNTTVAHTAKATMTAAVIALPGQVRLENVAIPEPGPGEIRIKVEGCGLCASSIPVWKGREWFRYPADPGNPGHESWGTVDAIGPDESRFRKGDRVACLSYNAYADYDLAKADQAILLPEFLNGKPFPGEPLGCAMNIFNRSDIRKGQTVAVVGSGFLGLLLIQLAKSQGAKVIAISQREFSLSMAEKAGADFLVPMDDHYAIIENVKAITGGTFCERVIEATGKEWPLNLSIELTAERGKLIVAGFHQDGMRQVNMQLLNWRGIDLISAHERDPQVYIKGMTEAVTAIEQGRMDPFPYFTHRFGLEELEFAFDCLTNRPDGFVKALIINENR